MSNKCKSHVIIYCILHSLRKTMRKHPWNFTHCLFWRLLCDVQLLSFLSRLRNRKKLGSQKAKSEFSPKPLQQVVWGTVFRELLPYWRGTKPNFQPPHREVAINNMKLHIPPLRVPAHRGWRPVARRDYGVKNISSVLNCWCKIVESKNVTTILLVGWFREWWY